MGHTRISHSAADPRKKSMKNEGTPNQRFITVSATYAPRTPAQFSTSAWPSGRSPSGMLSTTL